MTAVCSFEYLGETIAKVVAKELLRRSSRKFVEIGQGSHREPCTPTVRQDSEHT